MRPAIWLPASHTIHNTTPKFLCCLCDAAWYFEEDRFEYERHCLKAHSHEEVRATSPRVQAPGIFDPRWEGGDVEWQDWIDRNAAAGNDPMRYMRTDDGKHTSGTGDGA
jgi:hypothetical protein